MHIQIIVFYEHKYQTPMSPGFIDVGDGWGKTRWQIYFIVMFDLLTIV